MQDEASRSRIRTICMMAMTTAVVGYAIYWLRPVLVPFVIAVFVVSGVAPILDSVQHRLGVNRLVAATIAFVVGLLVVLLLGWSLWASTVELTESAPAYRARIQEIAASIESRIPARYWFATLEKDPAELPDRKGPGPFLDSLIGEGIATVSATLLQLLATSGLVLIYVFFLMLGASSPVTPPAMWREIDLQIREYLRLKTVISIITGAVFGLAIALFGLPMAITFGVLAFLLNYIPNIGPLVACLLPVPLIVLAPDAGIVWMASAIVVTSGIQILSGNVVEPKMMGDSTSLHPVVVLLALMFWGMMWGIVGMFLATPITAGLKIVLERMEATRPIALLMAGQWNIEARQAASNAV